MKTIESYLPIFPGFYNTIFDDDSAIDNAMQNIEEDLEEGQSIDFVDIDWGHKDYMDRVANAAIGSIENYLRHDGFSIGINFDAVYSPREYNFGNDVINCTYDVNQEDFNSLIDYLKANISEFDAFVEEKYSSRSGFMSFFATDLDTWFNEYLKDDSDKFERAFAGLLEFYLENEQYTIENMLDDCSSETSYIDYEIKNK
jgi:hypothetical protein